MYSHTHRLSQALHVLAVAMDAEAKVGGGTGVHRGGQAVRGGVAAGVGAAGVGAVPRSQGGGGSLALVLVPPLVPLPPFTMVPGRPLCKGWEGEGREGRGSVKGEGEERERERERGMRGIEERVRERRGAGVKEKGGRNW